MKCEPTSSCNRGRGWGEERCGCGVLPQLPAQVSLLGELGELPWCRRLWRIGVANVGVWRWLKNEPFLLYFLVLFFSSLLEVRKRYQHAGRIQLAAAGLAQRCWIPHPYSNRLNTEGGRKKKKREKNAWLFLIALQRGSGRLRVILNRGLCRGVQLFAPAALCVGKGTSWES